MRIWRKEYDTRGTVASRAIGIAGLCPRVCVGLVLLLLQAVDIPVSQAQIPAAAETAELDCLIEPLQTVKLASPVVGVIARLDVERGDFVRKGQVVGKLEDGIEVASMALARARATNDFGIRSIEARLGFLRRKHGRTGELAGRNVVSQANADETETDARVAAQQLKEAEANLEIARLEMKRAEEVLNQRTLRSPLDGVVVERLLMPGEYRNEQTPILTLAQIDPLRVEVIVPTSQYGRIRNGSKAKIRPEPPIGGEFLATVIVVDSVLHAATGTFGVRLELPNPDHRLPAGIRCRAIFELQAGQDGRP